MRATVLLLLLLACAGCDQVSDLKGDQEVVLFPTIGARSADGKGWDLDIHGCVYEDEKHRLALLLLRETLQRRNINLTAPESALLSQRARLFMVDHERGKHIVVRIGKKKFKLSTSGSDGQVFGEVHLNDSELLDSGPTLAVQAVLRSSDQRVFASQISLINSTGATVISDIDDTIKITNVRDRAATLRNTFLEPFRPVAGMAEVYQSWARQGSVDFFYVSASPWQLFLPLWDFIRSNGFPAGAFYLKQVRWKDESLFNLFESPMKYKPQVIEPLMEKFPNRRFILVGDSGESDPEIYGALARRYTNQVSRIFIRDVTNEAPDSARFRSAFEGLPPGMCRVFHDPAEIAGVFP